MFRDQPIKRKLMAAILLTSGAVMLLACGAFLIHELVTYRHMMVGNLSTLARAIAANSTAALAFDNREDARDVLSALAADRHIVAAGLYDTSGILFARYPSAAPDQDLPAHPDRDGYRFERAHLIVNQPVVNANRRLGTLYLRSDLRAIDEHLMVYGVMLAAVMALSGVLAFVLSSRLQRRISQPVLALARTAATVSEAKDYSVRAGKFEEDELGRLTDAFNDMLAQIQGQDSEIRALNADLERRVQGRTHALKEANQELEAFSYSVSHDLRAPLRHLVGFAALLEKSAGERLDEQSRRYLTTIQDSAAHMGRLIDDLLTLSRLGRVELRHTAVDLNQIVADAKREVETDPAAARVQWVLGTLPTVAGDPSLLRVAFVNLLSNAVKYSGTRAAPRIDVNVDGMTPDEVVVYVRDNGVGFDMQYAHKLFGVFQRLHRREEFDGTGIGLATVRRIVQRHGGRVWAEGTVDAGATFFLAMPRGGPLGDRQT